MRTSSVGFACWQVAVLRRKASTTSQQSSTPSGTGEFYVELMHQFSVNHIVCGIAPYDGSGLLLNRGRPDMPSESLGFISVLCTAEQNEKDTECSNGTAGMARDICSKALHFVIRYSVRFVVLTLCVCVCRRSSCLSFLTDMMERS